MLHHTGFEKLTMHLHGHSIMCAQNNRNALASCNSPLTWLSRGKLHHHLLKHIHEQWVPTGQAAVGIGQGRADICVRGVHAWQPVTPLGLMIMCPTQPVLSLCISVGQNLIHVGLKLMPNFPREATADP